MKKLLLLLLAVLFAACTNTPVSSQKTMKAFTSDEEVLRYFKDLAEKRKQAMGAGGGESSLDTMLSADSPGYTFNLPDPQQSVTNVQHEGVDEGGIVKVHGDHLVILRRGRLFTVAIGADTLNPVSTVDAFAPGIDPTNTWYDEMLIAGDTIAVIGYSYERGGTEVGLFNVDSEGKLSYRSTYHLRSNDYYSSRNYASRLIGNKLIFYSPQRVADMEYPYDAFPAVRKWHDGAQEHEFQRTAQATSVYRPEGDFPINYGTSLHTVTTCDLANGGFDCKATVVVGPGGHVFYVSPDSVYVWASAWDFQTKRDQALLFRMPLDGSGPTALRVSGGPVDQFSLLQSDDQHLNVLVRSESKGDGMWAAEVAQGDVALMRIPLSTFSDGSETVPASSYRSLPKPEGYTFQNRFVGDYLIYGTGSGWGPEEIKRERKELFLVQWAGTGSHHIDLKHGVDRIERMDNGAVIVGVDEDDLHFTSIRLAPQPEIASTYTRKSASQGEMRSHGFFYKPDAEGSGTLGLPISRPGRPGYEHLFENSAAILFLHNAGLQLSEVGELGARADKAVDDRCRASCVDWYGNARPLFLQGRVFALLGYELVEGRMDNGRINELRRVNYAPL
jgi:hypothetical protein